MTAPTLPFSTDRCIARHEPVVPIKPAELCADCLRRTAPGHPHRQSWMAPPALVEGYKLVPLEPTVHMIRAGENAMIAASILRTSRLTYLAMLAAAPDGPDAPA